MSSRASYVDTGRAEDHHVFKSYGCVPGAWPLAEISEEQPVEAPPTRHFSASSADAVRHVSYNLDDSKWNARSSLRSYVDLGESYSQPKEREPELRSQKIKAKTSSPRDGLNQFQENRWNFQSDHRSYIDPGGWHVNQSHASSVSEERAHPRSPPIARPFGIDGGWDTGSSLRSYIDPGEPHVRHTTTRSLTGSITQVKRGEPSSSKARYDTGKSKDWDKQSSLSSYVDPCSERASATKVKQWLQDSASPPLSSARLSPAVVSGSPAIVVQRLPSRKAAKDLARIEVTNGPRIQRNEDCAIHDKVEPVDLHTHHSHDRHFPTVSVASTAGLPRFIIYSKAGDTAIIDADVDYAFPPRRSNSLASSPITAAPVKQQKKPRAASVTLPHIGSKLELLLQPLAVAETGTLESLGDRMSSHQPPKRSKAKPYE